MTTDSTGHSEKNSSEEQAKCHGCSRIIEAQDQFCRFCGHNSAVPSVQELVEVSELGQQSLMDDQLREKLIKFNEQKAKAIANKRKIHRNPYFVFGLIALVVVSFGIWLFTSITSNEAHNKLVVKKNNWSALIEQCNVLLDDNESFAFDGPHTIRMSTSGVIGNVWLDCVGRVITVDPPNEFSGEKAFNNLLTSHITDQGNQDDTWSGGAIGTVEITYGNLNVITTRTESNHYDVTITMNE